MPMSIRVKRAYDPPAKDDGHRVLVDGVWPRGVKKEDVQIERWLKEVAPSTGLRKWFGHDPEKWDAFKKRYGEELADRQEVVDDLVAKAKEGRLTLVFSARDTEHNNAVALKEHIERRLDD